MRERGVKDGGAAEVQHQRQHVLPRRQEVLGDQQLLHQRVGMPNVFGSLGGARNEGVGEAPAQRDDDEPERVR